MMKVNKDILFYDTSAMLNRMDNIFKESFVISTITLSELERIKEDKNKDFAIKHKAQRLIKLLMSRER